MRFFATVVASRRGRGLGASRTVRARCASAGTGGGPDFPVGTALRTTSDSSAGNAARRSGFGAGGVGVGFAGAACRNPKSWPPVGGRVAGRASGGNGARDVDRGGGAARGGSLFVGAGGITAAGGGTRGTAGGVEPSRGGGARLESEPTDVANRNRRARDERVENCT